jgi:hypothetical protein
MPERYKLLLESSGDRFREAHFYLHQMEQFYHYADPFRWSLNAFLKSLREVPQVLSMENQNRQGFTAWFNERKAELARDPLISFLGKQRDILVHQGMLKPVSGGTVGITEGRGIKAGLGVPLDPLEDSDDAMLRVVEALKDSPDFLGLFTDDEDSRPCVQRVWRMEPFADELIDLAAKAWLKVGETMSAVVEWLGETPQPLDLNCRHSARQVQFKHYERKQLREWRSEFLRHAREEGQRKGAPAPD